MWAFNRRQAYFTVGAVGVILAVVLLAFCKPKGPQDPDGVSSHAKTTVSKTTVVTDLNQTTKTSETSKENIDKVKVTETRQNRTEITETFSPTTGKLLNRKTVKIEKDQHENLQKQDTKTVEKNKTEDLTKQQTLDQQKKTVDVETHIGSVRSGFSVGGLVTPSGAGLALDYEVINLNDKLRVEASAGVIYSLSPRVGAVVSAEVLPRLSVGAGAYVVPSLPVRVEPGVVLQYRF